MISTSGYPSSQHPEPQPPSRNQSAQVSPALPPPKLSFKIGGEDLSLEHGPRLSDRDYMTPYSTPATATSSDQVSDALPRLDSVQSIDSSGSVSKTVSFFASSPILRAPSTSRHVVGSTHTRSDSASSVQSLSAAPPHQLLPPASLVRSTSSAGSSSNRTISVNDTDAHDRLGNGSESSSAQRNPEWQHDRRPLSFRAAIQRSSPSDFYDTSNLSSASSIRSRRNWDDFEGNPITPLPSPGIGHDEMEGRNSMFTYASGPYGLAGDREYNKNTYPDLAWQRSPNVNRVPSLSGPDGLASASSSSYLAAPGAALNSQSSLMRSNYSNQLPEKSDSIPKAAEMETRSISKTKNFFTASLPPVQPVRTPVKSTNHAGHSRSVSNQSGNSNTSWESPLASGSTSMHSPWPSLHSQSNLLGESNESSPASTNLLLTTPPPTTTWDRRSLVDKASSETFTSQFNTGKKESTARLQTESQTSQRPQSASSASDAESSSRRPILSAIHTQSDFLESRGHSRQAQGPSDHYTKSSLMPAEPYQSGMPSREGKAAKVEHTIRASSSAMRLEGLAPMDDSIRSPSNVVPTGTQIARVDAILGAESDLEESEDEATNRVGRYRVERTLGVGAFSRVVLGTRLPHKLAEPHEGAGECAVASPSIASGELKDLHTGEEGTGKEKDSGASRLRTLQWSRPWRKASSSNFDQDATSRSPSRGIRAKRTLSTAPQVSLHPSASANATNIDSPTELSRSSTPFTPGEENDARNRGEVVALKMMEREPFDQNQRMRVSWVREVEVLKHIEHPSLIRFIESFSTHRYHVLVLERVAGGELFDLLSKRHLEVAQREWLVRRLFAELANAVGWMHSIHLVHRDIKLENIILTRDLFRGKQPLELTPSSLGPIPLLKLTDFGLSRFMDPNHLLETRCGSEEYAAPELIIGQKYDGRKTDCWAMGVVLYSLICGGLPFVEGSPGTATSASTLALGGGNSPSINLQMVTNSAREGHHSQGGGVSAQDVQRDARTRKAHLLRIAKGDLRWPSKTNDESLDSPPATLCPPSHRLTTPFAKHIVSRLLRRDASKRMSAWECFEDPWLTHGSFHYISGGEATAQGQIVELPPNPRSAEGASWLSTRAYVRAGDVGPVAKVD